ncbi:MAG: hypothetical protein RR359_00090 [Bacilli bacterium]
MNEIYEEKINDLKFINFSTNFMFKTILTSKIIKYISKRRCIFYLKCVFLLKLNKIKTVFFFF